MNPCKKGLSLLDPIKRQKDNIKYGIDIWNVYDFMYLNHNKIPQLVVLEIVIPYESDLIIESKSLKLYPTMNGRSLTKYLYFKTIVTVS